MNRSILIALALLIPGGTFAAPAAKAEAAPAAKPTLQPLNEAEGEKGPDDAELDRSFDEILKIFSNKDRF